MYKNMYDELNKFLALKTLQDANRDVYNICNLFDKENKIDVSLVFLRDWDSLESDEFGVVIINGKGAVFTFPSYWLSISEKLSMHYFETIIDEFYRDYANKWFNNWNNGNNNTGINDGMDCPCNPTPLDTYKRIQKNKERMI